MSLRTFAVWGLIAAACLQAPHVVSAQQDLYLSAKPIAEKPVPLAAYEYDSKSPWGGWRTGGYDSRSFHLFQDGRTLLTQDAGIWQFELWDAGTGTSQGKFGRLEAFYGRAIALSPDGKFLVSASELRGAHHSHIYGVSLWNMATRQSRSLDEGVCELTISAVAVSPDGRLVAVLGSSEKLPQAKVYLWDSATGDELAVWELPRSGVQNRTNYRSAPIGCASFSPNGRTLALVIGGQAHLLETATGQARAFVGLVPESTKDSSATAISVAVSPDSRYAAVACWNGQIYLWDLHQGRPLLPLSAHEGEACCVRFSDAGRHLWSFGRDHVLRTWSTADFARPLGQGPPLTPDEQTALWEQLAGKDQRTADLAARRLAVSPADSLPLLAKRLQPAKVVPAAELRQAIADARSADYNTRKRGAQALRRAGAEQAAAAIKGLPAAEDGRARFGGFDTDRAEAFVEALEAEGTSSEHQHALLVYRVLEYAANAEAIRLLEQMAGGAEPCQVTQQAKAVRDRIAVAQAPAARETDLDKLVAGLASGDAQLAWSAQCGLALHPQATPALLKHLKLLAGALSDDSAEHLEKLIGQLDADEPENRTQAAEKLVQAGSLGAAALRAALKQQPSPEKKRRIHEVLPVALKPTLPPERLAAARTVETLEMIGGPAVREGLAAELKGTRHRWLTAELTEALRRLEK
jgi:hypothetical protein